MSVTRALALNTGFQVIGKVISTVLGIFVVGLMTRYLGQEGFGMYSTANAFLQFFAILLDFGLNVMVVQMLGEHAGDRAYEDRIVSATFTLRTICALILLTLAPIIGLLFPYPWELKLAFFAIWGSFFTSALNQIVIGVQQRHLKTHIIAIGEVAGRVVLLVGILIARAMGLGLVPIVCIVSIGSAVNFFINFFAARHYASFRWNIDIPFWKILLRRSWPIGLSILFNLIYFKADTLILSWTRSQAEVGIYGAAYRVLEIVTTIPFMYSGVLLPVIAKSWVSGDHQRFSRLLNRSYDAMVILLAPMIAAILVLAQEGMTLVAGAEFVVSGDVLRILSFAAGAIFFGTISGYAVVSLNAQRKMIPVYIVVAIFTLAGYAVLIPTYGMWAAAWLTVFSETCVAIASTILVLRVSRGRWSPTVALKAVACAVVMGFVILPLKQYSIVVPAIVGSITYLGLILLTGAISKETLHEILSLRNKTAPEIKNPIT